MKKCLFTWLAALIFVYAWDFAIHGIALMDLYTQTSQLWRAQNEMLILYMVISQVLFAGAASCIYCMNHEGKGIGEGVRFGFIFGLLLASIEIGKYAYMPIPFMLMVYWALAALGKGIGLGVVLSMICGCGCKKSSEE